MNKENKEEEHQLLKRIDNMIEELHLIRRSVADLLVAQADSEARAASCEASVMTLEQLYSQDFGGKDESPADGTREEHVFIAPEGLDKEPIDIDDLPRQEEIEIDEIDPTPTKEGNAESDSSTFNELFQEAGFHESIDNIFIPLNDEEVLETAFEEQLSFSVTGRFSLADRYFYANELFGGDQFMLAEVLSDIEKLSSWSQVESYLYDVNHLNKEDDVVKEFVAIIRDSSK